MGWWQPAEEQRGKPFEWMAGKVWRHIELSFPAAKAIYAHICIIPMLFEPANDRDALRW
jgi:hypothetical protein